MSLNSSRELEVAREKLRLLESCYAEDQRQPDGDAHMQEVNLRSLHRMINQLKEEIVRYEARTATPTGS
jgi:hypothetical protein